MNISSPFSRSGNDGVGVIFISQLLDSEIDGEKVSDDGILAICFLILTAGTL
jgi:hypothetical protein